MEITKMADVNPDAAQTPADPPVDPPIIQDPPVDPTIANPPADPVALDESVPAKFVKRFGDEHSHVADAVVAIGVKIGDEVQNYRIVIPNFISAEIGAQRIPKRVMDHIVAGLLEAYPRVAASAVS